MDATVTKVFNGYFTITNPATGAHRTFRIHTKDFSKAKDKSDLKRVVSVLRGSDNTSDYTGFAFIDDNGIKVWKRFKNGPVAGPSYHEKLARTLWGGITGQLTNATFEESKHCQRCNRLLTHPESLLSGYGPECVKKV